MSSPGKQVKHFTNPFWLGVGQVETLTIQFCLVCDEYRGIYHVIDRHNIDTTAFKTQGRHPGRYHFAHLLDQLEEVVRTIDLVNDTCF